MKVLFVAQNMKMGGIQRALVNTCKIMKSSHPDIEIDIFSFAEGELSKQLPQGCNIFYGKKLLRLLLTPLSQVKKKGTFFDVFLRYAVTLAAKLLGTEKVYRFILKRERLSQKYDTAISYFNDVFSGISNKGTNLFVSDYVCAERKIAWIHTDPIKANFDIVQCAKIYKNFDKIICVSNAIKKTFDEILPQFAEKTHVVYNVFPTQEITEAAKAFDPEFCKDEFNIVTVGRADNSTKRIDRALDVCEMLKKNYGFKFRWRIIGDGPDLSKNIEYARQKDISDITEFLGNQSNPYPYVYNSDIFVLTSDYEGYPMVVCEAMLLETPVVTTPFKAAHEIIADGQDGLVASTRPEDIAEKIAMLINDKETYNNMVCNLKSNNSINSLWKEQINSVLG